MVYGRYNELDNYGIHGVYEPTNITGGHHPTAGMFFKTKILIVMKNEDLRKDSKTIINEIYVNDHIT